MPSAALLPRHQDPEPSDDEARLLAVMAETKATIDGKAARSADTVSPITVQIVTGLKNRSVMAVLLEHCQGKRIFYADDTYRRHVAALMDLALLNFCKGSPRMTQLTPKGQATACKILATLAEGLKAQAEGE